MVYIMFLFFQIHTHKDALSKTKQPIKQKHWKNKNENQQNTFQA